MRLREIFDKIFDTRRQDQTKILDDMVTVLRVNPYETSYSALAWKAVHLNSIYTSKLEELGYMLTEKERIEELEKENKTLRSMLEDISEEAAMGAGSSHDDVLKDYLREIAATARNAVRLLDGE